MKYKPQQASSVPNIITAIYSFLGVIKEKLWQFDRGFGILDLMLLATAALMILTEAKVFFFHIIFVILTFGAFYWKFTSFVWRSVFWVSVTTAVVLMAILGHKTQSDELIEIPLLTIILILVFVIARQRSNTKELLRHSEEKYRTLFDNLFKHSRDAIFITNPAGTITHVNQALTDLFGRTEEELVGQNFQDCFVTEFDRKQLQQEYQLKEFVRDYELNLTTQDGVEMACLLTSSTWRALNHNILGYQGIIRDITHRKKAVEALRQSEQRYRRLVELSFEAMAIFDAAGTLVHLNSAGAAILGAADPATFLGRSMFDFIHPDYLKVVKSWVLQATKGGPGAPLIEEQFIRLDGTTVDVECAAVPITFQLEPAVVVVMRDISSRKQAAAERELLLRTEHEQRLLAETLGEIFLALTGQISHTAVLKEVLRQVQRVVPYTAANIVLLNGNKLVVMHHQGYEAYNNQHVIVDLIQGLIDFPVDSRVVKTRQPVAITDTQQHPLWVTMPETAWVKSSIIIPICLRQEVIGLLRLDSDALGSFSNRDIDVLQPLASAAATALENARLYEQAQDELAERKLVEKELREISARNQAILDMIPDWLLLVRHDGRVLNYKIPRNNPLPVLMGKTQVSHNLSDILPTDLVEMVNYYIGVTLNTQATQIFEYECLLPSQTRHLELCLVKSGPDEVFVIVRDITERKVRAAALESERARIARDLHDSLGHGLAYLLLKFEQLSGANAFDDLNRVRQDISQMRNVSNQAYEVVRSMLAASLPSNSTDFASALLKQAKTIGTRAGFTVHLTHCGLPHPLSAVMQQQLLYLLREALVNVEKHANANKVTINLGWLGQTLSVILSDDGQGFPPDVPPLEGHFGLAIMQQRARDINGQLRLTSNQGKGTRLMIRLPLAPPELINVG